MLSFKSIHFSYQEHPVLSDVTFDAAPGEITCIVGPSGCGKTTLLGLAAGLLEVQSGEVQLDGEILGQPGHHLPPEQRAVGLVFQEGALFPHMTVARNVGFGLGGAKRNARVDELLALVGLTAEADRHPHTLSGGQRQRVALARALAPAPRALLFDEPYANLDQELRQALRREARDMVRRSGTIGLFVTHDPDDVMALADRVVVLEQGRVLQTGTPQELYAAPDSKEVARLFGQSQLVPARHEAGMIHTGFGAFPVAQFSAGAGLQPDGGALKEGPLTLCFRQHALELTPAEAGNVVHELRLAGADDLVEVDDGSGGIITARLRRPHGLKPGDRVQISLASEGVFLFPH